MNVKILNIMLSMAIFTGLLIIVYEIYLLWKAQRRVIIEKKKLISVNSIEINDSDEECSILSSARKDQNGQKMYDTPTCANLEFKNNSECQILSPMKEVITIGRQQSNDIVVYDQYVSRLHAIIIKHNIQFYIEDHNSKNGICINGKRIKKGELTEIFNGTEISIGCTKFIIKISE